MKVLTWNVQWFCGLDGIVDVARVIRHARTMADFDVLCLQEVAINYPRLDGNASQDQPQQVRDLLPGFDVFFGAAVDELAPDSRSRQRFGNLIATRLPVAQVHHYALPYPADTTPGGVRSMPRICVTATVLTRFGPVRFMTTHLEFYSPAMRMAQAHELLRLHAQGCALAAHPPLADDTGSPFQSKPHTAHCILTGDFNFEPESDEYALLQAATPGAARLLDAWKLARPGERHAPTFRLHDRRYGPEPITCDFLFVSDSLAPRVKSIHVDLETGASDHQPVLMTLA
ncbi:MAG: endonuclease/exonuclease/phosphatase family protein [Burkholderiales bacterium]|nr:endonuclease/exonuclease/phosphatase family protein [Burkholderiales bacterium]